MALDVKYINPFFASAIKVLNDMVGEKAEKDSLALQQGNIKSSGITVIVGITRGRDLSKADANIMGKGRVILDMSIKTAIAISGKIYMDEYTELNDEVFEALAELGNMISGNGITEINNQNKGLNLRLTPPSIFSGENLEINSPKLDAVGIKLKTSFGIISLNIAFEGKE